MKASEILEKARELVDSPKKWGQGRYAMNAKGQETATYVDEAVCFCVLGSISRAMSIMTGRLWRLTSADLSDIDRAHSFFAKAIDPPLIAKWNDEPGRTHTEVLAAFDRAIDSAKASEEGS